MTPGGKWVPWFACRLWILLLSSHDITAIYIVSDSLPSFWGRSHMRC